MCMWRLVVSPIGESEMFEMQIGIEVEGPDEVDVLTLR